MYLVLPLLTRCGCRRGWTGPTGSRSCGAGLRGAVTLALALAVTENLRVPVDIKREVGILATGFTLFTLLVQGTTLRWVISLLGLDKLSPLDRRCPTR
jgi:monovalent cation:H+ antiporter, CPA1 family